MAQDFNIPPASGPVQEFPAPGPGQVIPPPVQPKKNNTTLIIAIVVGVILLCCCCVLLAAYLLWRNGDSWFQFDNFSFDGISMIPLYVRYLI